MLIYENTTQRLREEASEVFSGGYSKFWMAPLCINAKDRSLQWIMVRTSHSIHCSFALPCRCEIMQISWHTKCFKFQCFQCTVADFTFFFFLIGVCIPLFLHKHNMANNNKYHYYSQLNFYGCIGFTGWSCPLSETAMGHYEKQLCGQQKPFDAGITPTWAVPGPFAVPETQRHCVLQCTLLNNGKGLPPLLYNHPTKMPHTCARHRSAQPWLRHQGGPGKLTPCWGVLCNFRLQKHQLLHKHSWKLPYFEALFWFDLY